MLDPSAAMKLRKKVSLRSRWTKEEDTLLRNMVETEQRLLSDAGDPLPQGGGDDGAVATSMADRECIVRNWASIADNLSTQMGREYEMTKGDDGRTVYQIRVRTGKQCRERYLNHLDSSLKHSPFSLEEDDQLVEAHNTYGNKWADIAKIMVGRSQNAVKNRWHTLNKSHKNRRRFKRIAADGTVTNLLGPPPKRARRKDALAVDRVGGGGNQREPYQARRSGGGDGGGSGGGGGGGGGGADATGAVDAWGVPAYLRQVVLRAIVIEAEIVPVHSVESRGGGGSSGAGSGSSSGGGGGGGSASSGGGGGGGSGGATTAPSSSDGGGGSEAAVAAAVSSTSSTTWHDEKQDAHVRARVGKWIFNGVAKTKPDSMTPDVMRNLVQQLEVELYRVAPSRAAYADETTLARRVNRVCAAARGAKDRAKAARA